MVEKLQKNKIKPRQTNRGKTKSLEREYRSAAALRSNLIRRRTQDHSGRNINNTEN